jgi:hypothetical protein
MMKNTFRLLWLMALPMLLGLSACSDRDDDPTPEDVTIAMNPDEENITEDQMSVMVTADLPTAVLGTFDEGSTGAALMKRLPVVTSEIGPDTKMVLVPGTMFNDANLTSEELDALTRLGIEGGYLAIERPTAQQLFNFAVLYAAKLAEMQEDLYQEMFNISEQEAAAAARSSQVVQRAQARMANIKEVARTRGADDDLNAVQGEMIILGPTDYFMQEKFEAETTVMASETDSEGNTTESEETVKQERTAAISGELADAAAEWLNTTEKYNAPRRARAFAMTRSGSGGDAINSIMDASETFTFNGAIYFPSWDGTTKGRTHRLSIKVSSWGVHNMESNKDYYYLKERVLMSLGDKRGDNPVYYPLAESAWWNASGYGEYNYWFGAFFSQYKTSMNLKGSGSITLEASSPDTDNNSQSTSITIGSSTSTTKTTGVTWGSNAGLGPTGPSVGISGGGSHSTGTTNGTSFSMGMSTSAKDLKVTRNTDGKKVTWTYDGYLPQYYEKKEGNKIWYFHQTPAAILVNDAEMNQEICWSVSNPSGQYTVEVTSAPKLAALIKIKGKPDHKYVDRSDNQTYPHQLLQPFRAMQTWRMNIENVEYVGEQHYGNLNDLKNAVQKDFSDLYVPTFQVADYDAEALNVITNVIKYSKSIFEQRAGELENIAKDYGVKKFDIVWSRDKVESKDAFTIVVCPKATEATQAHVGWVYGSDGKLYPSADYATGHKASAVGIVAYVNDGSDFGNAATEKASGAGHGLVLAMNQICEPNYSSATYRISKGSGTFASAIGNSMDNAKNDFDGLAKTKHLKEVGTEVGNIIGYMSAAPTGGTDWFIPSTGQWLAMLCKPGLGGAEIPTGTALNTPFNINGAEKLSSKSIANGGKGMFGKTWTSSGFNGSTGIYLVNGGNPRFTWYNSSEVAYIRPAFAF